MPLSKTPPKASKTAPKKSNNYRKPPAEHQFKKGVSGNPKGRPKNVVQAGWCRRRSPERDGLGRSNRSITVREGDKVSEMPAIEALLRTMFSAAATGGAKVAA